MFVTASASTPTFKFILAECDLGYGWSLTSDRCSICPIGTYSEIINADSCNTCPGNQTTAQEGSISQSQCRPCKENINVILLSDCLPVFNLIKRQKGVLILQNKSYRFYSFRLFSHCTIIVSGWIRNLND